MPPRKNKKKGKAVASLASSSPRVTRSQASAANMAASDDNGGQSSGDSPLSSPDIDDFDLHDDEARNNAVPSVHDEDLMQEDRPLPADRAPVAINEQPRSPIVQQSPAAFGGEHVPQANGDQHVAPVGGEEVRQPDAEQRLASAGGVPPGPVQDEQRGSASRDRPRRPFVIPAGSPVVDLTLSEDEVPKFLHAFTRNKRDKRDDRSMSPRPRGSGSSNTPRTPRRRGYGGGATCGAGPEYGGSGLQSGGILSSGGGSSGLSVVARESGGFRPARLSKSFSDIPDSVAARRLFKTHQAAQEKADKARAEESQIAQRAQLVGIILDAVLAHMRDISATYRHHAAEIRAELYQNALTLATNAQHQERLRQSPSEDEEKEEDQDAEMKDSSGAE